MRSRTSFFNRTVFLHDLRRYWPLTAGYALLWLLALPLSRLTELNHDPNLSGWNMNYNALDLTGTMGWLTAVPAGIFFAMAAFSYLTNTRATYGVHTLPVRREALYVTHYLAGLCAQLAPQFVAVLLTEAVLASRAAADLRVMGLMLLALALPTLFFYSFGVFCMMFTGQILAAPVFYGVLNVLVVGVEALGRGFAGNFLYGWAYPETPALLALSPVVQLAENGVYADTAAQEWIGEGGELLRSAERTVAAIRLYGLDWLLVYAAAGLIFAALGLLAYRRRRSEDTGSVVAIRWARPVFKYGVAFCAALALGQLLYYLFFGQYRSNGTYSLPGTLGCMSAAGLIGYFTAEMLLRKSFRVWKAGWRGAAAVTAVMAALGCVMTFDLTGYEGRVPDAADVDAVELGFASYYGEAGFFGTVRDPRTVQLVTEAHRAIVADKQRQQNDAFGEAEETYRNGGEGSFSRAYFTVSYAMRDGSRIRRDYSDLGLLASELGTANSPAAALTALYNDPDITRRRALNDYESEPREYQDLRFMGGTVTISKWKDGEYLGDTSTDLSPVQAERIYDAVLRDVALGHAEDSLFGSRSGEHSVGVELYASCLDPKRGDYTADMNTMPDRYSEPGRAPVTFRPDAGENMTETRAVLRELGALE